MILFKIELFPERESRRRLCHIFNNIISLENLLLSWQEFLRGKREREDIAEFSVHFMDNILALHSELRNKAPVRDRLLHHAVCRILYSYFDRKFIHDSYSCRISKGTHRAINRFRQFGRKVSRNNTRTAWVLKCDIKKFFASISHQILIKILKKYIGDDDALWLLEQVIGSFRTENKGGFGLPLGNLSSQLLINIYMNEFDQFVKRKLKVKYYIRYADDFLLLHENKIYLENLIPQISKFLRTRLRLSLHPKKVFIKTLSSGIDFLGWVTFPYHRALRTATKRRMFRKLKRNNYSNQSLISYLGLLKHGNTYKLIKRIKQKI